MTDSRALLPVLLAGGLILSGCINNEIRPDEPAPQAATAPQPEAAAQPVIAQTPVCKDEVPKSKSSKQKSKAKTSQDTACVKQTSAVPPPAQKTAAASGGYDLSKNTPVTDSTKVTAGQGTEVSGINDWKGEITGVPAANSRFTKLKIGMPLQQAIDIAGTPTDQGAYVTGKAFIPFYFGSDKVRWEVTYKGQGRLIFSNQAGYGSGQYLTWIIHNSHETGYR